MTSTPEDLASASRELALAALHEITPASTVGPVAGYTVEDGGALTLRFENRLPGYPGWYWTVGVAQVEGEEPTILEVELMPGDSALLAPEWVPWDERLADYRAHQTELAEQAAAAGVPLVGLCTGTFLLFRAGLMKGYRGCVSWFHHKDFLSKFDGLKPVSDQIFVIDRDRLTCAGGASTAHLAAFLVERHVGRAPATKSLHIMMIPDAEKGESPQPGLTLDFRTDDPLVNKAMLFMQQCLDMPLSIEQIARQLNIGKRRLERHFREALSCSPFAAFMEMRLTLVHHLLETSDKSIAAIAAETGFCDSSHLSRMFRRRFEISPQEFRKRVTPLAA